MTAKDKAKELYDKYSFIDGGYDPEKHHEDNKQCAIIAVEELINHLNKRDYALTNTHKIDKVYWQEVKSHLESL